MSLYIAHPRVLLAALPQKYSKFKFLEGTFSRKCFIMFTCERSNVTDTIPRPISIAEAMERRAAKEREMLEDDPAISATAPSSPPTGSAQLLRDSVSAPAPNTKGRARQSLPAHTNGKQANGAASASISAAATPTASASANANTASTRASRARDRRGRWSNGPSASGSHEGTPESTGPTGTRTGTRASTARIRNQSARAREAAEAAAAPESISRANGAAASANGRSASNAGGAHGE